MEKFIVIANAFDANVTREALFESRPHLVAPVVLLVEGVHNGFLYRASELEKYPSAWDGISLPIQHPRKDGDPVSANNPATIETQSVGNLFGVRYDADNARLVGEIWIDINKATRIAPEVLAAVRGGRRLEVSTGLYFDIDPQSGTWNGEQYTSVAVNYRPDHLALLPGGVGACSWSDGCGVRANEEPMTTKNKIKKRVAFFLNDLVDSMGFGGNEDSHEETRRKIQHAIDALDNNSWVHFIKGVYDNYVIYEAHGTNPNESSSKLYKRDYSLDDEAVVLAEEAIEVTEEKTYVPVGNDADASPKPGDQPKETVTMHENDAAVQALIACKRTRFTEADAEWLKGLKANQLDAMKAVDEPCPTPPKPNDDPPAKPDANDDPPKPVTLDSFVATAPPEVASVLKRAVARENADKEKLVAALVDNERCEFTKEQLAVKDLDELNLLSKLARVTVDFGGQAGGSVEANEDDQVQPMPAVFEKKTA